MKVTTAVLVVWLVIALIVFFATSCAKKTLNAPAPVKHYVYIQAVDDSGKPTDRTFVNQVNQ